MPQGKERETIMADIPVTVTLETRMCIRGHAWAHTKNIYTNQCPHCSAEEINLVWKEVENRSKEIVRLRRSIASLKGALTKVKNL